MKNKHSETKQPLWRLRTRERIFLLMLGDLLAAALSLFFALYIWSLFDAWLDFSTEFLVSKTPAWYYALPFLWLLLLLELYDIRRASKKKETFWAIIMAAAIAFILYLIIYFSTDPATPLPRMAITIFIPLASLLTITWRFTYINIFTTSIFMRRVLIVGAGKAGTTLTETIRRINPPPFHVVGMVDDDPAKLNTFISGYQVLGNRSALTQLIKEHAITDIICAIQNDIHPILLQELMNAEEHGIEISTMPIMYEELTGRVPIKLLNSDWLLRTFFDQAHVSESYSLAKRLIDILVGIIGLGAFILTYPVLSLLVAIDSPGPIFLRQERIGKNGKPYTIIKYRTMVSNPNQEKIQPTLQGDQRITRIGKILRKSHLDELPQVLIILKGEMTIVGPRAEITELVAMFQREIPFYRARFLVKPGLTGWAQIHQAYAATVDETIEKLEYDLYYIKHRTLFLDIQIMIRTISQVLGFRGR